MQRRAFLTQLSVVLATSAATFLPGASAQSAVAPKELRVDYAYYSPASLAIKKFGWLEDEFKADGTEIKWVLSQGSNRALEFLAADAVDFGSTAGLAAVLARANGNPIKTVYVYSKPEWTALVVSKDSPVKSIEDLRGRKVAATKGTDPYLFLLRSLNDKGLTKTDIQHVHLQHADGRAALEQGRVDAWAGLDPHMAASELDSGTRIVYRNVDYNTYGFLNAREKFVAQYPQATARVIKVYERARKWIQAYPADAAKLLAAEAKISLEVAKRQLARTDFNQSAPGAVHVSALKSAAPILVEEGLVKAGTDVARVIDDLVAPAGGVRLAAAQIQ
ncbi:MAG: aliphatic sulfonate ABC transporter substrate-binding protein [Betaproteobacteria bacterium]|nr:aliphatic sulfonate ABC transporter substrate-binding protein [Betaproteobacteria bacterium]